MLKKRNKAQIARILHPRESFTIRQSAEKSDDIENNIVRVEERLAQKDQALKAREDIQKRLEDDKSVLELQLQQKSAELQKMQRQINEKELTIRIEQSEAKKAMHMIDELKDVVKSNKQLQAEVEQKTFKIQKLEADKQRLKEENRIGLNSQRNMELEDLGLTFRMNDEDEVVRKPGNEKAYSDNFVGLQSGLTTGSESETTEIGRADNELEAMTGSFVMDANNRNVPTNEDEYFERYNEESFVSKRDDELNRSQLTEIDAGNELFDNSYLSPEQISPVHGSPDQACPEEESKQTDIPTVPYNFEEDFLKNIRNCIHLENQMLLIAMKDLAIVMSEDMETLAITNFKAMFGDSFEGQAQCFKTDSTGDANSILIGFNSAQIPDYIQSSHVFDGSHVEGNSWIARFIFDKQQKKLVRSSDPEDSVLIKREAIRSFTEF